MKGPLGFGMDDLLQEALQLRRKLADGLKLLPDVEDVGYGATAREEVWSDGKVKLYRFIGAQPPSGQPPLLIVYALVNRPYMVDLQDGRSLVQKLLAAGQDVYVLDWGYPDRSERFLTLEDYLLRYVDGAVDHLRAQHGGPVNLLGICQGGVFSLCYAALRPHKVRNLVTMVAPVDFHTPDNMLSHWARHVDVDLFVDTLGNVPADLMNASYLMLKPFRLNVQKYVGLVDILDDRQALEDFLRMEKWIFDSPDLAGEAFREFVKQFYQGNGLMRGSIRIGDEAVDLAQLRMPVLNIYAEQDHLVPPAASQALRGKTGTTDYTELGFRGGHIGIYVSARAQREVPSAIHDWLSRRA
ncbi:MAG: class III poly(R)-hydroxyalkanoic acid synthase subunit PhaC [Stenotrophomonas nitritireducens]|uniref:class III poly(R)-hydroxyalkanoic acid synthase subunit PhaC n=1 Tax=Stenotrophomonas nitritireducens TaxID=83617 RepID=UPI001AC365D4|nr:class III poly(R)-hydroxyalkanoic acid synthase subunit PhaC [Stenotrophomonas nitritireducens]MBN8769041.1 class III poly(R)-hydroxyalkanoic acid synthase subunit PhaC [Stenotrophomonas sp.]MBN8793079.1 class III poly(R)-hydroxyalkanoic acid synthase subunit PhaC [Stenotrophomonas nitritireducens]